MKQNGFGDPTLDLTAMLLPGEYALIRRENNSDEVYFVQGFDHSTTLQLKKVMQLLNTDLPADHPLADLSSRLKAY